MVTVAGSRSGRPSDMHWMSVGDTQRSAWMNGRQLNAALLGDRRALEKIVPASHLSFKPGDGMNPAHGEHCAFEAAMLW